MKKNMRNWFGHSLMTVASMALLAACADGSPIGPDAGATSPSRLNSSTTATRGADESSVESDLRVPPLTVCTELNVAEGSRLALLGYGKGVQIYRWSGTKWEFVAPSAKLYADATFTGLVVNHSAGPTWESLSGSKVVGAVNRSCSADAGSIPWLRLDVVVNEGPGIFKGVTQIQRLNTVGGNAPSTPGSFVGEVVSIPYTADYLFYRAP